MYCRTEAVIKSFTCFYHVLIAHWPTKHSKSCNLVSFHPNKCVFEFSSSIRSTINSSFCDSLDDYSTIVDFAGIHGSVKLYSTPTVHTSDITYASHYNYHKATVKFITQVELDYRAKKNDVIMRYELLDQEGKVAAFTMGVNMLTCEMTVFYPKLWWPVGMSDRPGYLYTLKVSFLLSHVHEFSRLTVSPV